MTVLTLFFLRMQGFIVFDYTSEYASARKQLAQWLAEGKIQRKETIVKGGLKAAEQALVGLYEGVNTGKLPQCLHKQGGARELQGIKRV